MHGAIDKVVEGVGAFLQFASGVPVVAKVVATADVGNGETEAALEQRDHVAGKTGRYGMAIGAVAIEINRRRTVYRRVFVAHHAHGYLGAIARERLT